MVFGTFDRLHKGHEHFLRDARRHGDFLVVVIARDSTVKKVKGRLPSENENERKMAVESSGIADRVILGSTGDKFGVIRKEGPDVICLGYDQNSFTEGLEAALESMGINAETRRLKAYMPEKYKTCLINKGCRAP